MFILDGPRKLERGCVPIPKFHLGHLGFMPGVDVSCRIGDEDNTGSKEITLTPFQGQGNNLFLLKCVFLERGGVVLRALRALAALKINILSLESATIDSGKKHVLFCILDWSTSPYNQFLPLDEDRQQQFLHLLPILPIADARYTLLIDMLFLFCGDALDHEDQPPGRWLPKIQLRLFDALQGSRGEWDKVQLARPKASDLKSKSHSRKASKPHVRDLEAPFAAATVAGKKKVVFFSETETKSLRMIFVGGSRAERIVHVAFYHQSRPGALLAIASLLHALNFNILTGLLRKSSAETNVWETTLEYTGGRATTIPIDAAKQVNWFRDFAFDSTSLTQNGVESLVKHMRGYDVQVARPRYPKLRPYRKRDFDPQQIAPTSIPGSEDMKVTREAYTEATKHIQAIGKGDSWRWLADLVGADLSRHDKKQPEYKGTVFVSLPLACKEHYQLIQQHFKQIKLETISFREAGSRDIMGTALDMIRGADYFFALWHPDRDRPKDVSPWMPFEYGVARSLGKLRQMLIHDDLPPDVRQRLEPSIAWMGYTDISLDAQLKKVMNECETRWLSDSRNNLVFDFD